MAGKQTKLIDQVKDFLDKKYPSLEQLYKYLHSHPELSSQEKNTSERIAEELRKCGLEVAARIGGYGVVGLFKNGTGPTIMLCTEMDALPIEEKTGLDNLRCGITAKYRTNDTDELLNDIFGQLNLTAKAVSIDSIGSLAILNDFPGKGTLTL